MILEVEDALKSLRRTPARPVRRGSRLRSTSGSEMVIFPARSVPAGVFYSIISGNLG